MCRKAPSATQRGRITLPFVPHWQGNEYHDLSSRRGTLARAPRLSSVDIALVVLIDDVATERPDAGTDQGALAGIGIQ